LVAAASIEWRTQPPLTQSLEVSSLDLSRSLDLKAGQRAASGRPRPEGIGRTYDAHGPYRACYKELLSQMIKRPLAWIPVAMSLAILAMVLTTIGISGAVRQEDEGTQAHIFQIWLVLEVVLVTVFAVEWVPRRPKQALIILAIQILGALAACAPVFYFRL
jgi:hypothetical protein